MARRRVLALAFKCGLIVALLSGGCIMAAPTFDYRKPEDVFAGNDTAIRLGHAVLKEDLPRLGQEPASPRIVGRHNIGLLMFAVLNQRAKAVEYLVRAGADPYLSTDEVANLGSPIELALGATKGPDLLKVMLSAGVSIEGGRDEDGAPLLKSAIFLPRDDPLRQLIAAGANVNLATAIGNSPLQIALDARQYAKAEILLDAGANPFMGTKNVLSSLVRFHDNWAPGTPSDLARRRIMARLREMGMTETSPVKPGPSRTDLVRAAQK
jgi:hypothetical protein